MSEEKKCPHGLVMCSRCVIIGDAARRMSGTINGLLVFVPWDTLVHSCMAFRLDDGTTDGVFYQADTRLGYSARKVALSHQRRPCCIFYFRNAQGGTTPKDCQIFLNINRVAYENDRVRWTDPDSPDLIISTRSYEYMTGRRPR